MINLGRLDKGWEVDKWPEPLKEIGGTLDGGWWPR